MSADPAQCGASFTPPSPLLRRGCVVRSAVYGPQAAPSCEFGAPLRSRSILPTLVDADADQVGEHVWHG
jgi:hypothetical protein